MYTAMCRDATYLPIYREMRLPVYALADACRSLSLSLSLSLALSLSLSLARSLSRAHAPALSLPPSVSLPPPSPLLSANRFKKKKSAEATATDQVARGVR